MSNTIITEELANQVQYLIETETCLKKEAISYEIQDEYNHLLISVSIDGLPENQQPSEFNRIANLIDQILPGKHGVFTWMVIFKKNGEIIDSRFGGDLNNPTIGSIG